MTTDELKRMNADQFREGGPAYDIAPLHGVTIPADLWRVISHEVQSKLFMQTGCYCQKPEAPITIEVVRNTVTLKRISASPQPMGIVFHCFACGSSIATLGFLNAYIFCDKLSAQSGAAVADRDAAAP